MCNVGHGVMVLVVPLHTNLYVKVLIIQNLIVVIASLSMTIEPRYSEYRYFIYNVGHGVMVLMA